MKKEDFYSSGVRGIREQRASDYWFPTFPTFLGKHITEDGAVHDLALLQRMADSAGPVPQSQSKEFGLSFD